MNTLEWLHPGYAAIAATSLLLILPAFFWARRQRRRLARILPAAGSDASPGRRLLRDLSLIGALVVLAACLAMPFSGRDQVIEPSSGRSLVFVLDASKSMNCRDCREVSRLDYARSWIRELLLQLPGDHVGLVSFAGTASSDCPLTTDHKSLLDAAAALEPGLLPAGSDLGAGLREAQRQFPADAATSRAIILLSDGEELGGDSKDELEKLKKSGVPVIAVALGRSDRNSPVLESDGKPLRRRNGDQVSSRPDPAAMEAIAAASRGLFVPFDPAESMMNGMERAMDRITKLSVEKGADQSRSRPRLIYQLILPLAIMLLLLRLGLSERKRVAAVALLCLLIPAMSVRAEGKDGEVMTAAQALELHNRVSAALSAQQDVRAQQAQIEAALKQADLPSPLISALQRDLAMIRHAHSLAQMQQDPAASEAEAAAAIDAYSRALKAEPASEELAKGLRSAHAARQQAVDLKRQRDEEKKQAEKEKKQQRQQQAKKAADHAKKAKEEQDKANQQRQEEQQAQEDQKKADEAKQAAQPESGDKQPGEGEKAELQKAEGGEPAGDKKSESDQKKAASHQAKAQELASEAQAQAEGMSQSDQASAKEAGEKAAAAARDLHKAQEKMKEAKDDPKAGEEAAKLLGDAVEKLEAFAKDGEDEGKGGEAKPEESGSEKPHETPKGEKPQPGEVKDGKRKPSEGQLADQMMEQKEKDLQDRIRDYDREMQRRQRRQERTDPASDK